MGKQSKTKSTQAAVAKDKDIECRRTIIENKLIEEAKYDENKTEQLHALVDGMLQDLKEYQCSNNIIADKQSWLPIESIDDVPIDLKIKFEVFHPYVPRIDGVHPNYDRVHFRVTGWIQSKDIISEENDDFKRYFEFPFKDDTVLKFESEKYIEQLRCMTITFIIELLQVIPTLWFDKFAGNFKKGKQRKPIVDLFQFDNTKVKSYSECVVCYEMTKTTTPCKHPLCYKCNENIKVVDRPFHNDQIYRACPMCRENVLFEHSVEHSDEDE